MTGLKNGANTITATSTTGAFIGAKLVITNHPIGGPVLLGSQAGRGSARRRRRSPHRATRRPLTPAACRRSRSMRSATSPPNSSSSTARRRRVARRRCPTRARPRRPRRRNNCFQPYTVGSTPADLAIDDDDGRAHGAIHRARRARHDQPRHLRHRGAVRPDHAGVDRARAAAAVERQGASTPSARRPASRACSSAPSRTGPTTRRCRAASWSSTTA